MAEVVRRSPGAAFFLSIIPGAGHLYAGRTGAGIAWLASVVVAWNLFPVLGLLLHFVCAVSAATSAASANRAEKADLARRRESAADVARMLDEAAERGGRGTGVPAPAATTDPPPRILRGAFPVPPERLLPAIADGMREQGLLVLGVDGRHGRVRGSVDHGGGRATYLVAQVEPTPSGSRVRLLIDRPEGSAPGHEPDDAALRAILEAAERNLRLAAPASGSSTAKALVGASEALTEDHFLEQLREAWESFEHGWLPEAEWTQRKRSLIRSVTLRQGTRKSDFMTACRPLVEAGVLHPDDLRALDATIHG